MSITRLQQARQLYAVGQLVSKTLDGSRPGYRGPGEYQGGTSSSGKSSSNSKGGGFTGGGGGGADASTKSFDKSLNPNRPGGPIGRDDSNVSPAYEMIGGKKYDVTPNTRKERELARMKQTILEAPLPNITKKGTEYYDPNTGTLLGFAPTNQKKFGLLDLALIAATGGLFGTKIATGAKMFNTAKNISKFAQDIGLTDKNVVGAFTDNLTSNLSDKFSGFGKGTKSTTKSSIDTDLSKIGNGDGGLGTLENMDALNQEYLLLLEKFNKGVFTDADQVRFTFLKNILKK